MSILRSFFLLSLCCAAFGCETSGGGEPEPPAKPTPAPSNLEMDPDNNQAMPPH